MRSIAGLIGFLVTIYALNKLCGQDIAHLAFGLTLLAAAIYGTLKC